MTVTTSPRPPDLDDLQALIEEARQRARRRRRRYAIVLVVLGVAGAGLYAIVAHGSERTVGPVRGSSASGLGPQILRRDQFWYTRTIRSLHESLPAGGVIEWRPGHFRPRGPEVRFDLRISDETWVGVDGTIRERMIIAGARFASAAGRASWAAYGRPVPNFNHVWLGWLSHDGIALGGDRFPPWLWFHSVGEWTGPAGWDVGDGLFTYRQLLSLPTGPAALRARLRSAEQALARREERTGAGAQTLAPATAPFSELSDIASLLTSPVPAAERHALFRAAVTLPGTTVNPRARDSLGRPGVAVSAFAGPAFERLIFNPASGALLEDAPYVAVLAQGVVGSAYTLPKGVSPINPAGAPPEPQTPAIDPVVGNSTTVFEVRLSTPGTHRSRQAPVLDWLLIGTPSLRCFGGFMPSLPPLLASASIRRGGRLTYVYRLAPTTARRHTWCPGRYELNILPDYSRRVQALQAFQDLTAGVGSSIFFQVS